MTCGSQAGESSCASKLKCDESFWAGHVQEFSFILHCICPCEMHFHTSYTCLWVYACMWLIYCSSMTHWLKSASYVVAFSLHCMTSECNMKQIFSVLAFNPFPSSWLLLFSLWLKSPLRCLSSFKVQWLFSLSRFLCFTFMISPLVFVTW